MADVTVTLANPYEGHEPGETLKVDPQLARDLRNGGIAEPAEAAHAEQTVDELKDELRKRELPVTGSKVELLKRLADADGGA